MSNPPQDGAVSIDHVAAVTRDARPALSNGKTASPEPFPEIQDEPEFEVMAPSDAKETIDDIEDDLAIPLEPLSREFIHENFPVPSDLLEIDPATFDTEAAMQKYGYKPRGTSSEPIRRALLIGIKGDALKGCHNDVEDMKKLLINAYNWREDEIILLKDQDPDSKLYPTREAVVDHLFILVHQVREGDRLFLHCHGSQIEDLDGDESDGLDEVICCADGKVIVDDVRDLMALHEKILTPC